MMFLGIYLHAVAAYSPERRLAVEAGRADAARSLWSISVIHVFRMPIFYAMAGFFTALLIARYGLRRAAWNRFMRIAVPFVVGWMIVWPLTMFLAGLGYFGLDRTLRGFASGRIFDYAHPMHLWFLEYLIVLYVLAAIALAVVPLVLSEARAQGGLAGLPRDRAVAVGAAGVGGAVVRRATADAQSLDRGSAGLHPGVPHRRGLRRPVRLRLAAVPAERSPGDDRPARLALRRAGSGGERRLSRELRPALRSRGVVLPDPRRACGGGVAPDLRRRRSVPALSRRLQRLRPLSLRFFRISSTSPTRR